ncbi:RNA-binding signal recognition particle subunit SRP14 PWA37_001304 [Arxiozyma heterogenica]|uniref:Signal recognition particle subunit SRP14 n=1 Tax=Arxiozyma heterogenica TaxID=278026 RepID=A0AAN7ZXE0_9SACH|nr:hypothetical protein RI543_003725 [Kazachstania heterogenica]
MTNDGCIDQDAFLKKAEEYFKEANKKAIAVRFTMKRYIKPDLVDGNPEYNTDESPKYDISKESGIKVNDTISQNTYNILVRISYGVKLNKHKCSTIVPVDSFDKFWLNYSAVTKNNMDGLIKKKKKKVGKSVSKNKIKKGQ